MVGVFAWGTLKFYLCVCVRSIHISQILFCRSLAVFLFHAINLAFAKIPIGGTHGVCMCCRRLL